MNNIKSIRLSLGATQQQLADELGCSIGNISHYECQRQDPRIDTAYRLIEYAKSLGVTLTLDKIYSAPELSEAGEAV